MSDKLNTPFWQGTKFVVGIYFALPTTVRQAIEQFRTEPWGERMPGWKKEDYSAEQKGILLGIPAMVAPTCGLFALARASLPFPLNVLGYADIATQLASVIYEGSRLVITSFKRGVIIPQ